METVTVAEDDDGGACGDGVGPLEEAEVVVL